MLLFMNIFFLSFPIWIWVVPTSGRPSSLYFFSRHCNSSTLLQIPRRRCRTSCGEASSYSPIFSKEEGVSEAALGSACGALFLAETGDSTTGWLTRAISCGLWSSCSRFINVLRKFPPMVMWIHPPIPLHLDRAQCQTGHFSLDGWCLTLCSEG